MRKSASILSVSTHKHSFYALAWSNTDRPHDGLPPFSLVLLDEATSALDIATETKLLEALRALAGKLTIVMVAHRLRSLANCDKLLDLGNEATAVASIESECR